LVSERSASSYPQQCYASAPPPTYPSASRWPQGPAGKHTAPARPYIASVGSVDEQVHTVHPDARDPECCAFVCGEVRTARKMSCSAMRPWSRGVCVLSRSACLAAASEWRGWLARGAAQSRTASRNPSLGRRASTRPSRRASPAVTSSPPRMSRAAWGRPIRRGSRWVPPAPGMAPSATSGKRK
jgi:hypothetical protein